jgi:catalase
MFSYEYLVLIVRGKLSCLCRTGCLEARHEVPTPKAGEDQDYLTRDLWEAIARSEFVEYELNVQMMEISKELNQTFDPLDPIKTWPEDKFRTNACRKDGARSQP